MRMRKYNLTDIFPVDREVEIAGRSYAVKLLTLNDLAAFTRWVGSQKPHPYESIRDTLDDLEEGARRKALQKAYREADQWWGSSEGDDHYHEAMCSPTGILCFLAVVLRENNLTSDELMDLSSAMTPQEFLAVRRAAYGRDPHREVRDLLKGDDGASGVDWAKVVDDISERHPAWTLEYIGNLTIGQLAFAKNGAAGTAFSSDMSPAQVWAMIEHERRELCGEEGE